MLPPSLFKQIEYKYINACIEGNVEAILYMLKHESTKIKNKILYECLCAACENCHDDIVDVLLTEINISVNDYVMFHSCKGGNKKIIEKISAKLRGSGATEIWKHGAYGACEGGQVRIFREILNLHFTKDTLDFEFWNLCLNHASNTSNNLCSGNIEIIKFIIDTNKTLFPKINFPPMENNAHLYLYKNSCLKIIELYMFYGADDWNLGLAKGCSANDLKIIELMIKKGANDWNQGLFEACYGGHYNTIKLMIEMGATNFNYCLSSACLNGNIEIVEFLIASGANNFDECLKCVPGGINNLEILNILVNNGATNWNDGLMWSCLYDNIESANFMIQHGANNIDHCLNNYCFLCKDEDIQKLLINRGAYNLDGIKNTKYFRSYCFYCKYIGVKQTKDTKRYLKLLYKYPPYILLVGSRLSKNCSIKKVPTELFRLLTGY